MLRLPARFVAEVEIRSANEAPVLIPKGSAGWLLSFDEEGDLAVSLDVDRSMRVPIFLQDAGGLTFPDGG